MQLIRYAYDPSGSSIDNLIQDEPHTLDSTTTKRIIIPTYIPFYTKSLVIIDKANGRTLDPSEYYLSEFEETIQRPTGLEIADTIVITNRAVSDNVAISYQVVGGPYQLSPIDNILKLVKVLEKDDREVIYNYILGKPTSFPPAEHMHDIGDVYGMEYICYAIDRLTDVHKNGLKFQMMAIFDHLADMVETKTADLHSKVETNKNDISTLNTKLDGSNTEFRNLVNQVTNLSNGLSDLRVNISQFLNSVSDIVNNSFTNLKNFIIESTTGKVKNSLIPVSPDAGNLITMRPNGIYYGTQAPADLSNIYVDSVYGNDNNPGTRDRPLRTMARWCQMMNYRVDKIVGVNLRAGQDHLLPPILVTDNGKLYIKVYDDPYMDGDKSTTRAIDPSGALDGFVYQNYAVEYINRARLHFCYKEVDIRRVGGSYSIVAEGNSAIELTGLELYLTAKLKGELVTLFGETYIRQYESYGFPILDDWNKMRVNWSIAFIYKVEPMGRVYLCNCNIHIDPFGGQRPDPLLIGATRGNTGFHLMCDNCKLFNRSGKIPHLIWINTGIITIFRLYNEGSLPPTNTQNDTTDSLETALRNNNNYIHGLVVRDGVPINTAIGSEAAIFPPGTNRG